MNTFVIADPKRCIGCRTCEVACVLAHSSGAGLQALSAAHFIPRLRLIRTAKVSVPVQCHQRMVRVKTVEAQKCDLCATYNEGPACIRVCLTKALRLVDQKVMSVAMKSRQENAAIEAVGMTT